MIYKRESRFHIASAERHYSNDGFRGAQAETSNCSTFWPIDPTDYANFLFEKTCEIRTNCELFHAPLRSLFRGEFFQHAAGRAHHVVSSVHMQDLASNAIRQVGKQEHPGFTDFLVSHIPLQGCDVLVPVSYTHLTLPTKA